MTTTRDPDACERCERVLDPKQIVWLELDTNTNLFHRPENFPADGLSQGLFTFGRDCAKRELARTKKEEAC